MYAKHPTQKPLELFSYLIKTYTRLTDIVFDPCIGSGTTALAARNLGRHFIGGDISREYVAMARERLQRTDGFLATIVEDGILQPSLFEQTGVQ